MSWHLRSAVLVAALVVMACGGSETEPKTPTLNIGADTTLLVEETTALSAHDGDNAVVTPTTLQWVSSNPSVATISANGTVSAVRTGTTTITATSSIANAHVTVAVAPQFLQIATAETHSCGLNGRHQVYCWGGDFRGELGALTTLPVCEEIGSKCSRTPVLAATMKADSLITGTMFSCALDAAGSAFCWGANFYGQLGNGTKADNAVPQPVAGSHHFVQLVAGRFHACGITDNQDAYCWGWDYTGQLGAGDVSTERCTFFSLDPCSTTPRLVTGNHKWAQLAADDRATCGITTTGEAFCWGLDVGGNDGLYCQVADDTTQCAHSPITVGTAGQFKSISIGDVHRCEQKIDNSIECWGANYWGAFGNGSVNSSATPVSGAGGEARPFFVSSRDGMCYLDDEHHARCWGNDMYGQVGDGFIQDSQTSPIDVNGGWSFATLESSGAADHVCGITTESGKGVCWGRGVFGQLGTGVMEDESIPAVVSLVH